MIAARFLNDFHKPELSDERRRDRNVMITAGNMQGVNALLHVVLDPGDEVVVTDTIALRPEAVESGRFRVVSISHLLGEAIRRINSEESVSSLFV